MSTKTFSLEYTVAEKQNDEDIVSNVGVVIVAAGSSSRMGGINKIVSPLCGVPVIQRTVSAFESNAEVKSILLVTREDMIADLQRIISDAGFSKVTDIVAGGDCREESVKRGFDILSKNSDLKIVLVHDGARPLVSEGVINRVINAADSFGTAIPAVPVKDTVKRVGALGKVEETLIRDGLVNIQTPQGFKTEILSDAFLKSADDLRQFTDDSSLVEAAGNTVFTVMGDYKNIKITTPEDMLIATAYIEAE